MLLLLLLQAATLAMFCQLMDLFPVNAVLIYHNRKSSASNYCMINRLIWVIYVYTHLNVHLFILQSGIWKDDILGIKRNSHPNFS